MELKVDDVIVLHEQFGDGWATGYNERSKKTGAFPFEYVTPADSSRMMLMVRPATVYGRISTRISRAFGGAQSQPQAVPSSASLDGASHSIPAKPTSLPPKPTSLPPKPTSLPPKPSPKPPALYQTQGGSQNPLFGADQGHY